MLRWNTKLIGLHDKVFKQQRDIERIEVELSMLTRSSADDAPEGLRQLSECLSSPLTDYERGLIDGHKELLKLKSCGGGCCEQAGC